VKNRLIVSAIILAIFSGLVFFARFIKKGTALKSPISKENSEAATNVANIGSYLKEADAFLAKGSLMEAKEVYQRLMNMPIASEQLSMIQANLENLNIKILLSGINIEQSQVYEVKPGDVLINIAQTFNTTVDSIVKSNNIKNNVIYPGMKLRILKGIFNIFVDKSQNILLLKFNDEVVKTYSVSTGDNNSTPIGTFKIVNKLVDPTWYKDGQAIPASSPENILGTRWLGFDLPKYGIHGTIAPEDIGKQATQGCVRMRNEEVEELFSLVPVGTEVTIID
jgi:lipoprotein-anchoring transpeptidase ErfK/SrfK